MRQCGGMFGSQFQTVSPQPVVRWTVDYGDGGKRAVVLLPHAWRQDVSVEFEGPVTYRADVAVPRGDPHLLFERVSYAAEIFIDGLPIATHEGIWDAFAVPLSGFAGRTVEVEVRVTKNGGTSYPVRSVASGFLPYVYHTFGGIHGGVYVTSGAPDLDSGLVESRVTLDGGHIAIDGRPFHMRGLLHWGWYPDLGHPNPTDETVRQELRDVRALGFNVVKFCLWVPSHRYLELLRQEGMFAWMELPLWAPDGDRDTLNRIARELETVVRQYRKHDHIIAWTVGCELGPNVPVSYREGLTHTVRNLTGCPLVKDTSGGAEMYGEDLREFGDFSDFHPYCDTPFFPLVLDSLLPQSSQNHPILLGEFNDADVHRDLSRMGDEMPYWASTLPELNAKGVRWQYDLPRVLDESRFSLHPIRSHHAELVEASCTQSLFIRKFVLEATRARDAFGGYVLTGWRDTPISSSGIFDDWSSPRYTPNEVLPWNGPQVLYLIPHRQPKWNRGGNRPGYRDTLNYFAGSVLIRVGIHSESSARVGMVWRIVDSAGNRVAAGAGGMIVVQAGRSTELGQVFWENAEPGAYTLEVEAGSTQNRWPLWVVPSLIESEFSGWRPYDPGRYFSDLKLGDGDRVLFTRLPAELTDKDATLLGFLTEEGTEPAPFWREAAYEFLNESAWRVLPFAQQWARLLGVSGDSVLDPKWLDAQLGDYEVLLNRVDVRTYRDRPVLVRSGRRIITTLRPFGGLGIQPSGVTSNPAGSELLRSLMRLIETE